MIQILEFTQGVIASASCHGNHAYDDFDVVDVHFNLQGGDKRIIQSVKLK